MIEPKSWRAMSMARGSSGRDGSGREAERGVSGWSDGADGAVEFVEEYVGGYVGRDQGSGFDWFYMIFAYKPICVFRNQFITHTHMGGKKSGRGQLFLLARP